MAVPWRGSSGKRPAGSWSLLETSRRSAKRSRGFGMMLICAFASGVMAEEPTSTSIAETSCEGAFFERTAILSWRWICRHKVDLLVEPTTHACHLQAVNCRHLPGRGTSRISGLLQSQSTLHGILLKDLP